MTSNTAKKQPRTKATTGTNVVPFVESGIARLNRPRPPADLLTMDGLMAGGCFVAAPELVEWFRAAYLEIDGPLYSEDHIHLRDAAIGALWTNADNVKQGRRVLGQAEMPARSLGKSGAWQRARGEQQMREWFDGIVPDFVLTFDAVFANQCDDATFCALVDHELCHCAQAVDEFGMQRWNQQTGDPIWAIRGHDVEEFVSVVRRFGIEAAGEQATDLVIAAAQKPEIAPVRLSLACGTCLQRAA